MFGTLGHGASRLSGLVFGSLERRLILAISLIIACTFGLQAVSQNRALALRRESGELQATISLAEHSAQLMKQVIRFRLEANDLDDTALDIPAQQVDGLTDAAMSIGETVNAMRMDAPGTFDWTARRNTFGNLDQVVSAVIAGGEAKREALDEVDRMLASAAHLQEQAEHRRDKAYASLEQSTRQWFGRVTTIGIATLVLAAIILWDLCSNILPALRRMHGALRRLAGGDLDLAVERFTLHELRPLADALDTFRRNALAVRDLAFTDPATGLPNRRAFVDAATRRMRDTPAPAGEFVAVFDIDRFKYVNDDYGHAVGDTLVQLVGQRARALLGPDALVARIGGDEFAIYVRCADGETPAVLCSRLGAEVRKPFDFDGFSIAVTISLGYVQRRETHHEDITTLISQADLALYASKRGGRNRATGFTNDLEEARNLDRMLERDLVRALSSGELRMVYQPIYAVGDHADEVEALVRWRHPELGEVSPAKFIPAAERSGRMPQLGAWIIERALSDLTQWPELAMSLNLSPLQLQQDGFVAFLLERCRMHEIMPHRIILEVTETVSIERNTRALLTLELLRNAGFRIALDDFGTGYSSLCMMKTFRFDRLKLDRSLVKDIEADATSRAVFDAAVQMARQIGAEVVAEGVSEGLLVKSASEAGCTHLQGFHLSMPVEAEAIEALYAHHASAPPVADDGMETVAA
ncbi:putative bifunctional diguanylate cyclase/phosphodiesterase [Novosphingobium album (ex Hu et al. 2023)]|uniref:EAL domain-containing protein n=1 Tax=Novosphingobium album (ex Hu et al. 2023) TaxID=2930093 RepID=A0ABT0AZ77_9SPHN|nr:bifunctional diguanylate cyclase/phosphodiesterase [Novosphingobium album (ex Hu et al. 2023)]MCJ2178071.1 EAL domain-containing protein [Novosphingobium album (ex Hu et al. 2023)]